ncbi:hypothetical protein CK203_099904 [Vitis vinifera]|uniref:Chromo domain-containing protein n=1 Tax=Vitis vinifera TaxID=29760 RepID=A0A438CEP3_VITVI|nr:hypothetical protein CK203_099904 [Vitis vinifera]
MVLVKLLPQQFKSLRPVHKGLVTGMKDPSPYLGSRQGVYRVELPPRLKIHPVFHVEHVLTDRVIRRRGVPPATEYLVKWKGLPESEATGSQQMPYGNSRSRLSGSEQKARRGRLRLRWGRVSQDDSNEPPHGLYRARKLLETPRVGRVLKVLEMPGEIHTTLHYGKT